MAEYDSFPLRDDFTRCKKLDVKSFAKMLDNPTNCYKFYWLEAVVNLIGKGAESASFDEVFNEMISNAWSTVLEYHILLSPKKNGERKDSLERAVKSLKGAATDLSLNASKPQIERAIIKYGEQLAEHKKQLAIYVPCCALAGFYKAWSEEKYNYNYSQKMVDFTKSVSLKTPLPYVFEMQPNRGRVLLFHPLWVEYIRENMNVILGWIQHEKCKWLQTVNPEIPSIVTKLTAPKIDRNKLKTVHGLWDAVLAECKNPFFDIYSDKPIDRQKYAMDHFVPWSFVSHNELWNLLPIDPSINSKKSNQLPEWERYFRKFAEGLYLMYEMKEKSEKIRDLFRKCYKDFIHSRWADEKLFLSGNSRESFIKILEENMHPIYVSAKNHNYENWHFEG